MGTSLLVACGGGGGNFVFTMDADGIMTEAADSTFYGVMSADKTMIVATDTYGGNPEMWILLKDTGTTYTTADMAGDWVMHPVASGNSGSRGWTYGQSVVDSSGNDTFSGMMGNSGPVASTQLSFAMNGGAMTMGGTGGMMGGGMMGGKTLIVSSYSDGSGGYPFSIQVK